MWIAVLSCALLVLHSTVAEMHYAMYTSFLFKGNRPGRICIQVVDSNDSMPLQIDLEHPRWGTPVSFCKENLPKGDTAKCFEAPIPSLDTADIAYLSVKAGDHSERKSVVVNSDTQPFCIMQLSKPIYEYGQKVQCRIISLDVDFLPVKETILLFEVFDPAGNRLMQERNITPEGPIFQLEYQLIDDPEPGSYRMHAEMENGLNVDEWFEVKKYSPPKFETTLTTPQSVNILDDTMTVTVSGRYTYEKHLAASVEVSICRKPNPWGPTDTCNLNGNGICVNSTGSLGPDGTMTVPVDLLQFQLTRSGLAQSISVEAVITETGTEVQETKTASVWISSQRPTPYFDYQSMRNYHKPGINYTGALTLKDDNNSPIINEPIELQVNYKPVATCKTDQEGNCPFSFDTTEFKDDTIVIEAHYSKRQHCYESPFSTNYYPSSQYTVYRFYSKTGSYVQLDPIKGEQKCGQTINIQGNYILNPEYLAPGAQSATFTYMILANGELKTYDQVVVSVTSDYKGSFSIPYVVKYEIASSATVIVSTLLQNGEIVADSHRFTVERCFGHQVSLEFSAEKARPGSDVILTVKAAPGSSCGIRSIDESINILSGGQAQSIGDTVYYSRPSTELWGPWVNGFDLSEQEPACINIPNVVHDGVPYEAKEIQTYGSVADELVNCGVRVIASTDPRKPVICPKPDPCPQPQPIQHPDLNRPAPMFAKASAAGGGELMMESADASGFASGAVGGAVMASLRDSFPELLYFGLINTDPADGTKQINLKMPGTITKWDTTAFCISDAQGFGSTNGSTYVTSFQEFFTEPVLPVRIVRGEEFPLRGIVYNYLPVCKAMDLTLAPSSDYTAEPLTVENDPCTCENGRKTYAWNFKATKPGTINITMTAETKNDGSCPGDDSGITYRDTVIRQLIVEPEGIKREESQSFFICAKDGTTSETIAVTLPANLVEDSAKGYLTCLGDPFGVSIRNLDNLVQMPAGCGEQTMSGIVSNIVAYKYLNATNSLEEDTKEKILNNLRSGYYRMATFYQSYGCMSTWSRSIYWHGSLDCNEWLTAMSYGAFTQIREIGVFVDPIMVTQMESWIASQQNIDTGAFSSDGRSYNYLVNGNVSYTAHVAQNILKAGHNESHPVLRGAMSYLGTQIDSSADTVGQALSCYAHALAGDVEKQDILLAKLKAKTSDDARGVFLKSSDEPLYTDQFYSFRRPARCVDVFSTSHYLKCLLQRATLSADDLTYAARVGKWLGSQMNSNGGFASSMDTTAALEALAAFQKITAIKDASNTVTLKFGIDVVQSFTVNSDNNLLLQRTDLPNVPASYVAEVTGSGCVFIQTTLKYNVKPETMDSSYDLKVWTSSKDGSNGDQSSYNVHANISYKGTKDSSDMAILDVTLPSGYRAAESSLDALLQTGICQRYETSTQGHAIFYFNRVTKETISVDFIVEQTTVVTNLKPSPVMIYSYYEDEVGYAVYEHLPVTAE